MSGLRRVVASTVAVAALGAAPAAEAASKTVYAGPPSAARGAPERADFNAFFREQVSIKVGDTVVWQFRGFHNVLFPGPSEEPPFVVPDAANPVSDVRDPANAPFWFNGQPSLTVNPAVALPRGGGTTTGRQVRNSGLPADDAGPYRLRFTRAGTFRYLCSVHPTMAGSVRVRPRGASVPSARADTRAAQAELTRATASARRLDRYRPRGNRVSGGHDRGKVALLKFFPARRTIAAGQSVEFSVNSPTEAHNVAFGPRSYRAGLARGLISPRPAPNGQGPPTLVLNPAVFLPSDRPPARPPYDGRVHGGFLNTGELNSHRDSPYPSSARVTFTERGRYEFQCLIHPRMLGEITVR